MPCKQCKALKKVNVGKGKGKYISIVLFNNVRLSTIISIKIGISGDFMPYKRILSTKRLRCASMYRPFNPSLYMFFYLGATLHDILARTYAD